MLDETNRLCIKHLLPRSFHLKLLLSQMIEDSHTIGRAQIPGNVATFTRQPDGFSIMKTFTLVPCFTALASIVFADGQDAVQPGPMLSEYHVVDRDLIQMPRHADSNLQLEFKNGAWWVVEVRKGVQGVSSITTNSDGTVAVTYTNVTRLVPVRLPAAEGKVEPVNRP